MTDIKKCYCDFCGKSNEDVDKMIIKNNHPGAPCICNECVLDCVAILIKPQEKKEVKE